MSEGIMVAHTIAWSDMGATTPWHGVASPWLPSISALDSLSYRGKIEISGFVSSNSENISCVTFLKHKNSRK
jgi:hypothetical protein